jgi:hypothetical protein
MSCKSTSHQLLVLELLFRWFAREPVTSDGFKPKIALKQVNWEV